MKIITQELAGESHTIFESVNGNQGVTLVLDNGDKFTLYEGFPGVLEVRALHSSEACTLRLRIEPRASNTILVSGETLDMRG